VEVRSEAQQYPVRLSIDYQGRGLNRVTTFFRIIVAIPIFIVLAAVSGGGWSAGWDRARITSCSPVRLVAFCSSFPCC
jgi:hypothetical protein